MNRMTTINGLIKYYWLDLSRDAFKHEAKTLLLKWAMHKLDKRYKRLAKSKETFENVMTYIDGSCAVDCVNFSLVIPNK